MERKFIEQSIAVLALELRSFSYSDSSESILRDIEFEVQPGSLNVISGHSGSGKSTLGAIIAGLLPRHGMDKFQGAVSVGDTRIEFSATTAPRIDIAQWAKRIGFLPQDAGHYLSGIRGTVAEELSFSLENVGLPREQMRQRVTELAQRLRLEHLFEHHPEQLSGGQERLVALAALSISEPDVLVLDEPLTGLDRQATTLVSEMINLLRAQGTALVVLTSSNRFWAQGADALWSLEQGTLHRVRPANMPGHVRGRGHLRRPATDKSRVLLSMESVKLAYPDSAQSAVQDLDLNVRAGECLGLMGANGSGKTTVLKAIAGLMAPVSGSLNTSVTSGLLLQNSSDQLFERTVLREVSFGIPRTSTLRERIPAVLEQLGLESYVHTHPYELPASARRLVALATVLVREPELLLLDEPTEALDEAGEATLKEVIGSVLARGGAVILSTHNEKFMERVTHRVHSMHQ
ncbi:ABC transporter ATP-binding protein [Glutamicibacter sp. AGC46]